MMRRTRSRLSTKFRRNRAAALVELAICLPLLVFLVGASVEACDLIFLRNSLAAAAYAGTLEASRSGCTEATIRSQVTQSLDACRIRNYTVSIQSSTGAPFTSTARGDLIHIQTVAVASSNLKIGAFIPTTTSQITVNAFALR